MFEDDDEDGDDDDCTDGNPNKDLPSLTLYDAICAACIHKHSLTASFRTLLHNFSLITILLLLIEFIKKIIAFFICLLSKYSKICPSIFSICEVDIVDSLFDFVILLPLTLINSPSSAFSLVHGL